MMHHRKGRTEISSLLSSGHSLHGGHNGYHLLEVVLMVVLIISLLCILYTLLVEFVFPTDHYRS